MVFFSCTSRTLGGGTEVGSFYTCQQGYMLTCRCFSEDQLSSRRMGFAKLQHMMVQISFRRAQLDGITGILVAKSIKAFV